MYESLQLRRRHSELAFLALAGKRFRKGLLPSGRHGDDRQEALRREILMTHLAREPCAYMLGDEHGVLGVANRFGDAFENGGQIADRNAFREQRLQDTL